MSVTVGLGTSAGVNVARSTIPELDALARARPPHARDRLRLTTARSHVEINGLDLLDLVRAVERHSVEQEIAERIAAGEAPIEDFSGQYMALSLHELRKGLRGDPTGTSARHFVLAPDDPRRDKITLLGCDCGIVECWFLLARITLLDELVVWSEFEQFHRNWRYDLGPFVFEREAYLAAIRG